MEGFQGLKGDGDDGGGDLPSERWEKSKNLYFKHDNWNIEDGNGDG